MEAMLSRPFFRLCVLAVGLGLVACSVAAHAQDSNPPRGRKYKAPPPTARVEVTILKDVNGKPIENAAVVFHPMVGGRDEGNMELKTNEDGKAIIDVLPLGDTVRLQVIARGFQTYGEDYKVDKAEMGVEIRLKRPGEQYSIYKIHENTASTGKSPDGAPAKDATPPPPPPPPPSDTTPPATKPQSN
jgi:hypothetical protein